MARIKIISGLGKKMPAAFLLEDCAHKILFDCGVGATPGLRPDFSMLKTVDAVCLSHAHDDHVLALKDAHAALGAPDVYATEKTWASIGQTLSLAESSRRILPEQGISIIAGIPVQTGPSGHAFGGVWFYLHVGNGVVYMGDWSLESSVYPFVFPPPAELLITDTSYGLRRESLADQIESMVESLDAGRCTLFPVPCDGRAIEMGLQFARRGFRVAVSPRLAQDLNNFLHQSSAVLNDADKALLARCAAAKADGTNLELDEYDIMLAENAAVTGGVSRQIMTRQADMVQCIFSGNVSAGTPAEAFVSEGKAKALLWNVHPRIQDNILLAKTLKASRVVCAFSSLDFREELTSCFPCCEVIWNPCFTV